MSTFSLPAYAAQLRRLSWIDIARSAWMMFIGGALASLVLRLLLPPSVRAALRPLIFVAPLLPFIAKDLAHWPDARRRLRALLAAGARAWWRLPLACLPLACLPPELLGLFRLDRTMRRGCWNWLRRRPHAPLPAGQALTYLERGSYRTACAIVLLAALVELPLDAALVQLFGARLTTDPARLQVLHLLLLAAGLSTLVWVLGDRWLVGRGCHVLTDDTLLLRVGARTHGSIPLVAIAACRRIDETPAAWRQRHGVDRQASLLASPLDKPNAVLILNDENTVRLQHMGVERGGLACVFLYLDRPASLAQALAANLTTRRS